LAWWNTLFYVGCGVGDGGWASWRYNESWRKALRFSALRLLRVNKSFWCSFFQKAAAYFF
jgi:hypothetical protein